MSVWLCTRERVQSALDTDHTAYRGPQIDQAIDAASRLIEQRCHRANFHPILATRYFPWPNDQHAPSWELWLDQHGLITVTAMTAGGVAIPAGTGYLLEPVNDGPPYESVELLRSGSSTFGGGSTPQREIAITGLWGFRNDESPAGALAGGGVTDSATTATVTDGSKVGIGSLLRIESERVVVTDRTWVDSTFNLAGDIDADDSDTLVTVSGGTWFAGESIIIGAEEMPIKAVVGTGLVVERAANGTVLAAHTGAADVFVNRGLVIERAAAGTTAAAHGAVSVVAWKAPPLAEALCVAVAMDQVEQELGAYSRTLRSGEAAAQATGGTIGEKWAQVIQAYGRQARAAAI